MGFEFRLMNNVWMGNKVFEFIDFDLKKRLRLFWRMILWILGEVRFMGWVRDRWENVGGLYGLEVFEMGEEVIVGLL